MKRFLLLAMMILMLAAVVALSPAFAQSVCSYQIEQCYSDCYAMGNPSLSTSYCPWGGCDLASDHETISCTSCCNRAYNRCYYCEYSPYSWLNPNCYCY